MMNNHTCLIVDENKLLCWALKKLSSSDNNMLVTTVNTGSDAISELSSKPYHSVFLDVGLPDINWFDLFEYIRKSAPNTKVIVMAGNNVDYYRRNAMDEGAFHFMEKPFGISEFREIIRNILASNEKG